MMRDLNKTAMNGKRPHRRSLSRDKNLDRQEEEMTKRKQAKKDDLKALEFQLVWIIIILIIVLCDSAFYTKRASQSASNTGTPAADFTKHQD